MENKNIQKKPHSITIENRSKAALTGVEKVIASNETVLSLETSEGGLTVNGQGMKIVKFDADQGLLTFEGTVNQIKYSAAKVSLAKRIFK